MTTYDSKLYFYFVMTLSIVIVAMTMGDIVLLD